MLLVEPGVAGEVFRLVESYDGRRVCCSYSRVLKFGTTRVCSRDGGSGFLLVEVDGGGETLPEGGISGDGGHGRGSGQEAGFGSRAGILEGVKATVA